MEKAKISAYQLFVLIVLFEIGSALLVPLAIEAKQDAWLAILLGMTGGFFIFFMYHRLYLYYPDCLPTTYVQKIIGKFCGRILAFLYMIYFLYLAARVLRDFGEVLAVIAYPVTPITLNHAFLVLVVIYTVRKGIEVLARTGELFFVLIYLLAISGFILLLVSGLIDLNNLKPMLEEGLSPVIKVAFTQSLFFPFGEAVVFAMILPYLNNPKKAKIIGLSALGLSGINLAISMTVNIGVLGVSQVLRTQFPLLSTIQMIQLAEFLERLDIFFMLAVIVLGFFKISLFFYAAVIGTADLFHIKKPSQLAFPIGFVLLFLSIIIASNIMEHFREGLQIVPVYLHLPFQIILPLLLLIIAFFKNRKKRGQGKPST
ncbi:GerAB/ArcD/ProY family transporter [Bacillus aerolatus]|uniref:GerAB/ArcD/ProY family transporter n=1 Tax=Bacillus aerolatus TaxID=2653354 RepID=A0A6I1FFT2_9BACI|nr:GerAB/ArcD/ProY family transporter [Bacillus aerolatus]KAB7706980.1 GerAB/ArcD/ProY family transporter [Bacillus aerolatus]